MASSISPLRLEGKVAIVTGAASGIGECITKLFCKHGAKVVIADIQDELGQKLSRDLGESSALFVHCDVTKETDIENVVNTTVALFGKLDIMINNASIMGLGTVNILKAEKIDFERVLSTNLVGSFLGIKHAARVMIPNHKGAIICTASVAAVVGGASPYAYTSSKHALLGLMKTAAIELWEHGIRVNCVSPFVVNTPMSRGFLDLDIEGCRQTFSNMKLPLLDPEDVAEATLFLASDEAKYMNGHNLVIDGGYTVENKAFSVFKQSGSKI